MADVTDTAGGLERKAVEAWLSEHVPALRAPFSFDLVAGGRSNLTYAVTDGRDRRFVLRRPPLGHVLQSAHDMGREHRIISALAPTDVPVPTPLGFCDDPAVTGAPFYVMDFVDGAILREESDVEARFSAAQRAMIADALIDALAGLHQVDPDAVGLGELGRRTGYVERQLRRWHRQFEQSKSRDVPAIDEVHRRLSAHVPEAARTAIVHGDFRIDNCVIAGDGSVAAVLDWELATLGDPLADLGLLMVYWIRPGHGGADVLIGSPTATDGFPEREALVERYVQHTGADVSRLSYYTALGYWKLACIAEGIHARYVAGVMGDDAGDDGRFADQVGQLGELALAATDDLA
jgi:aminoglycoside phosphotransferase (APT) family kinase protein